ncbi:unnamed protein product [Rotaria sp. Silwood2]|nr:unnamed protein product [Rotaria sp. Silwood2]
MEAEWEQAAKTVAGIGSPGHQQNQIDHCCGIFVDENDNILIAARNNHRIMEWKPGARSGQVIAGGNGPGKDSYQLNQPTDVITDADGKHILICDSKNNRIVRWPRRDGQKADMTIKNISGTALVMDKNGFLYVSDIVNDRVVRYRRTEHGFEANGTVIAGGNKEGSNCDQFSSPVNVFIGPSQSLYVSDKGNHRVMKWMDRTKGVIVAGGHQETKSDTELNAPCGLFVDSSDNVYVTDYQRSCVMRFRPKLKGTIIAGGKDCGNKENQLNHPLGLAIDRNGNLYVSDYGNHRVQRFSIKKPQPSPTPYSNSNMKRRIAGSGTSEKLDMCNMNLTYQHMEIIARDELFKDKVIT